MSLAETPFPLKPGNGFTLIELSVVLVIIGLLIGGVLLGRDLIRASEIRSIISDKEKFVTAVYSFRTKYNAIPGDMKDAQDYWGAAASCSTAQTTEATCNGNGDGVLLKGYGSGTIGNEIFLFWKHLANAGLISGNYWGVTNGTQNYSTTKNNAPSGKIDGSLWYAQTLGTMSGGPWSFDGDYGTMLEFGSPVANEDPWRAILTAKEMWALDSKIDDGKPGTGSLMVTIVGTNCTAKANGVTASTSSDSQTAIYRTTSTGNVCALRFTNVF
jgi:prepilin-type N-terminal cleavage/methylation domain-containing protein